MTSWVKALEGRKYYHIWEAAKSRAGLKSAQLESAGLFGKGAG